jgi:hypothetical protein
MDTQNDPQNILEDVGQEVDEQEVANTPEEEQEAPMPSAEQNAEVTEQDELPEVSSDRTREQFNKLTEKNRELAKKLEEYERREKYGNSVYDLGGTQREQQPSIDLSEFSNLTQQQVDNVAQDFVDADGNVDINGLNNALRQANQRAANAENSVKQVVQSIQQAEQQRQLEEAYKEADWLDPQSDSFDETRYNLVRDRLTRYYSTGAKPRLVNVVREVEADLGKFANPKATTEQKSQAVKEYRDKQTAKAQASTVSSGRGRQEPTSDSRYDDLVERTRRGDKAAFHERLKAIESK